LNNLVNHQNINLINFKYNHIATHIPSANDLIPLFIKTTLFGKKINKRSYYGDGCPKFNQSYEGIIDMGGRIDKNVLYSTREEYATPRMKQAFLKYEHSRFYTIVPKELEDVTTLERLIAHFRLEKQITAQLEDHTFSCTRKFRESSTYLDIVEMQTEMFEVIKNNFEDYNLVEVADHFKNTYGKRKLSKDVLKLSIPITFCGKNWSKTRVLVKDIVGFKGKIFYGNVDDLSEVGDLYDVFKGLFGDSYKKAASSDYELRNGEKGLMFITMSKSNIKYMKFCKNAHHISEFYNQMLYRKTDDIVATLRCKDILERYENIDLFFKNKMFKEIYTDWADKLSVVRRFINGVSDKQDTIVKHMSVIQKHVKIVLGKNTKEENIIRKDLDYIDGVCTKNKKIIMYLKTPDMYYNVIDKETDIETFKGIFDKLIVF